MVHTNKIEKAIRKATTLHHGQFRKNNNKLPYISHLFSVASIASMYTKDEDTIVSALLHDSIEDTFYKLGDLEKDFGKNVRNIVESLTESTKIQKYFRSRTKQKEIYYEKISNGPKETAIVSAADKMHNMISLIDDYDRLGNKLWKKFSAPPIKYLETFEKVINILEPKLPPQMAIEYKNILHKLRLITKKSLQK